MNGQPQDLIRKQTRFHNVHGPGRTDLFIRGVVVWARPGQPQSARTTRSQRSGRTAGAAAAPDCRRPSAARLHPPSAALRGHAHPVRRVVGSGRHGPEQVRLGLQPPRHDVTQRLYAASLDSSLCRQIANASDGPLLLPTSIARGCVPARARAANGGPRWHGQMTGSSAAEQPAPECAESVRTVTRVGAASRLVPCRPFVRRARSGARTVV